MKLAHTSQWLLIGLTLMLFVAACGGEQPKTEKTMSGMHEKVLKIKAPKAAQKPHELTEHGHTRVDKYYWLRERENPEVIAYLEAENQYRAAVMAHLNPLQDELFEEIKGRIKEKDESVPQLDNGYWYYYRYDEGLEYPIWCRRKGTLDAPEEIMLDVNEMARDYDYYNASGLEVSPDNKLLAFAEDTLSRRIYTVRVKNLESGEMLEEQIPGTSGSIVWAKDNKTLFYGLKDETLRVYKIMKHRLGTPASEDEEVYHEEDPTFNLSLGKSKSKKYIIAASWQTLSQEYRYLDASTPDGEWKILQPRERGLEYSADHAGGKWYIRTNLNAKNFRLMEAAENATTKENWTELIPHRQQTFLAGFELFKNFLVLQERINGQVKTRIRAWDGSDDHYIDYGEDAYVARLSNNPGYETDVVRISYQSLTTPPSVFDYNMKTREKTLRKEQEVLGGFDRNNYRSERIFATARDGVKVPISIVYKKGFEKDGTQPLLLYGYGSYGYSLDPSFSPSRLSLLDRGFAFAIAHVRGGQEMGRQWYEDGKLLKKKNTFRDFIDCGEFLIKEKYTSPTHLYAMGGSAGGLLMGAVINMRPDLFNGVIAAVPFVDVVTTMLDESIPLTTFEWDEWGDPHKKEYYEYMLSYSPYDNVEAKDYPSLLVTTGLHDSQVQYWEPAKWVAKLRELKTDNNPLLLHTNMDAGHGGQSGRFRAYKEIAMEYAFLLDLEGLAPKNAEQ